MRVCAVICEYNPFHLGHAYHLRAAREASGADYVLCLMSGALTQRGAFARHDKWLRARRAKTARISCSSCRPASPAPPRGFRFRRRGAALPPSAWRPISPSAARRRRPCSPPPRRRSLSRIPGFFPPPCARVWPTACPIPCARALAAEQAVGLPAALLAQPNATALALEYLQALPPEIVPVPVERRGSGYHDAALSSSPAQPLSALRWRGDLPAALSAVPSPAPLQAAEARGFVHEEEAPDAGAALSSAHCVP